MSQYQNQGNQAPKRSFDQMGQRGMMDRAAMLGMHEQMMSPQLLAAMQYGQMGFPMQNNMPMNLGQVGPAFTAQSPKKRKVDHIKHTDGFAWRKYGQKVLKRSNMRRSYYRCSYPDCPVKKTVERKLLTDGDSMPMALVCQYSGNHDHLAPAQPSGPPGIGVIVTPCEINSSEPPRKMLKNNNGGNGKKLHKDEDEEEEEEEEDIEVDQIPGDGVVTTDVDGMDGTELKALTGVGDLSEEMPLSRHPMSNPPSNIEIAADSPPNAPMLSPSCPSPAGLLSNVEIAADSPQSEGQPPPEPEPVEPAQDLESCADAMPEEHD